MSDRQPGTQHPEEYRQDLNPHGGEGENSGHQSGVTAEKLIPLSSIKEARTHFTDEPFDLDQMRIVAPGVRLEQGGVYVNARDRRRVEFKASAQTVADEQHWYVPKQDTDYVTWNRLIHVTNPERLDEETE